MSGTEGLDLVAGRAGRLEGMAVEGSFAVMPAFITARGSAVLRDGHSVRAS